jgi:hypothetical protein
VAFAAFAVFGAGPGLADDVPTQATIGSTGSTPVDIECGWVLPDVDDAAAGIQYGPDENTAVPTPTPCTASGAVATQPDAPGHTGPIHITISPNPEDQPSIQQVQFWGAVSTQGSPNTPGVFWKIYHPGGVDAAHFKEQIVGTAISGGAGSCPLSAASPMFVAASTATGQTGQLTGGAITNMIQECQQGAKVFFYATLLLHKWQPCGLYTAEMYANQQGFAQSILTYHFDVPCTQVLRIDFDGVNWGTINGDSKVFGEFDFDVPACTATTAVNCPTVKNVGNSGASIQVIFTDMVQCSGTPCVPVAGAKRIIDFDACFAARVAANLICQDPAPATPPCTLAQIDPPATPPAGCADKNFDFSVGPTLPYGQVLCANDLGKLDLSIHPVGNLPPGSYVGTVTILIKDVTPLYCGENGTTPTEPQGPSGRLATSENRAAA